MYFSKLPSKSKHGKTPVLPRTHIIQDLTAALKQTRCTSPCCCPVCLNSAAEDNSPRLLHISVPPRTLLMQEIHTLICCCSINNKLWHHWKKKIYVKVKFSFIFPIQEGERFPLETAVCCAPALRAVLVTALKHSSPQAVRKATQWEY